MKSVKFKLKDAEKKYQEEIGEGILIKENPLEVNGLTVLLTKDCYGLTAGNYLCVVKEELI